MDPRFLDPQEWAQIGFTLKLLWLWVPFVVIFAFSLLMALAVIPSLAGSRHVSGQTLRLRPALIAVGLLSLITGVAVATYALLNSDVISGVYNRWLI